MHETAMPRPSFRRAFTFAQIDQAEQAYNATHGVNRRVVQVVLTKSSGELLKLVWRAAKDTEGTNTLSEMIEAIRAYQTHLTHAQELSKAAEARLLGCALYLSQENTR